MSTERIVLATDIAVERRGSVTHIVFPDGHDMRLLGFCATPLRNTYYLTDLLVEVYSHIESFCHEEYIYTSWLAHAVRSTEPHVNLEYIMVAGKQRLIDREMRIPLVVQGPQNVWQVRFEDGELGDLKNADVNVE